MSTTEFRQCISCLRLFHFSVLEEGQMCQKCRMHFWDLNKEAEEGEILQQIEERYDGT